MNKLCRILCNAVLLCTVLVDITNACRGGTIIGEFYQKKHLIYKREGGRKEGKNLNLGIFRSSSSITIHRAVNKAI